MGGLQESFALSVPAEKAGPIVAKFHATCSKCPAFVALGEWELTGPTDAKGGFRTVTMPGAKQTHACSSAGSACALTEVWARRRRANVDGDVHERQALGL